MKNALPIIAIAAVLGFGIYVGLINEGPEQQKKYRNEQQTAIFSCGFVAGQGAIMSRMPSLFKPEDIPKVEGYCERVRDNAIKNGFGAARNP